jgi:hypothetical protein
VDIAAERRQQMKMMRTNPIAGQSEAEAEREKAEMEAVSRAA